MQVIIEYFWDYNNNFLTKVINVHSDIHDIKDIPDITFQNKNYKPKFMNENTMDKDVKNIFVYCQKEDDTYQEEKKNYKNKLFFIRGYDTMFLIPTIFRNVNLQCIKTRLPLDNYHIYNNFEVTFEIIHSKQEEYKMIKYILLRLLNTNGFTDVDIKDENEEQNMYQLNIEKIASINYIR